MFCVYTESYSFSSFLMRQSVEANMTVPHINDHTRLRTLAVDVSTSMGDCSSTQYAVGVHFALADMEQYGVFFH
jgi:hypothetical protein